MKVLFRLTIAIFKILRATSLLSLNAASCLTWVCKYTESRQRYPTIYLYFLPDCFTTLFVTSFRFLSNIILRYATGTSGIAGDIAPLELHATRNYI